MQLTTVPFTMTRYHCHIASHDHVVDILVVAKPPFIILSYKSRMHHCYPGIPPEAFFGAPPEGAPITKGFYINTIASPMKCVIINGTMESFMAIYLGMAMEMP